MKKIRFMYLVVLFFLGSFVFAVPASAAGMKIGVLGWYSWWNSDYMEMRASGKSIPLTFNNRYTLNSAPLYGPMVGFDIRKWSLNSVFLCGNHFRSHSSYGSLDIPLLNPGYFRGKSSIFKYDLDTTLNYAFTRVFKVFLGFKYQGYQYESRGSSVSTRPTATNLEQTLVYDIDFDSFGPGLGIGVTVPLVRSLYLLWNGSALYSRVLLIGKNESAGAGDYSRNFLGIASTGTFMWQRRVYRANLDGVGCNTILTLAYLVPSASLTISLGGRYQFIRYYVVKNSGITKSFISQNSTTVNVGNGLVQDYSNNWGVRRTLHNKNDHFYGLIFSVIYSIDFTRDNHGNG